MEMKMSEEQQEPRRLTIDDPIPPDVLKQLANLHNARVDFCDRNANLDQEKIAILAALKHLDDSKTKLFESLLVERGLAPDTEVSINPRTGTMQLLRRKPDGSLTPEPPPAETPSPAEPDESEVAPEPVHSTS